MPNGTENSATSSGKAQLAQQAAKLARKAAKRHLRRKRSGQRPALHSLVNGLVQALVWATTSYAGPALRVAAATAFHGNPKLPKLSPWNEPVARHHSTQCAIVESTAVQTQTIGRNARDLREFSVQTELSNYEMRCCVCFSLDANCITNCSQVLCTNCAFQCLREKPDCPYCRQKVSCACPLPGQRENEALPDPAQMWPDLVSRMNDSPVRHNGIEDRYVSDEFYDMSIFRRDHLHLDIVPLSRVETGSDYFDRESRNILLRMYQPRFEEIDAPWRSNVYLNRFIDSGICRRTFNQYKCFDLHNIVFHSVENPELWPQWAQMYDTVDTENYPETRRCIFCQLLVDANLQRLREHFRDRHLMRSIL